MLSQEQEEKFAQFITNKFQNANDYILETIGKNIKKINNAKGNSKEIQKIIYNNDYEKMIKQLRKISSKNMTYISQMFEIIAKDRKKEVKKYYKFRNIQYKAYEKDEELLKQIKSNLIRNASLYIDLENGKDVGLVYKNQYKQLKIAYDEILNEAATISAINSENYNENMKKTLKEVARNGLVKKDDSGRIRRIEALVYYNVLDGIRHSSNEIDERFGKEYGADGIEISVHSNPAPDHADIQGKQFTIEEFEKLQSGLIAKDIEGNIYNGGDKRPISQYNCFHRIYRVVLEASQPLYSNKELQEIKTENSKGFNFEGKKYTNYEGTQLQRKIESEIRKQKSIKAMAKASENQELVNESKKIIDILMKKYKKLGNVSGLEEKYWRM